MSNQTKLPFMGMRTLKTVIAVILSALVMKYIFKETPFFACIGALVAVERTMATSFKMAFIRNIGTISGGFYGIVTSFLTTNVALLALGLIPMIYTNHAIGKKESIVPGGIVYFAVVYLNTAPDTLVYGTRRIWGTLIGSLIGIAVNYFICRPAHPSKEC